MKRDWRGKAWVCMIWCLAAWPGLVFAEAEPPPAAGGAQRSVNLFAASNNACSAGGTEGGECVASPLGSSRVAAFYRDYDDQRTAGGGGLMPGDSMVARTSVGPLGDEGSKFEEDDHFDQSPSTFRDPLEPMNRAFYHFNDKLYFWFLKPVGQGYRTVVPETARIGVRNFFDNLAGPARMVNCLLQGKGQEAGYEFVRLFMNTLVGVGGLVDVAGDGEGMDLEVYDEDLGQTLGVYGWKASLYIHWPFLGPSCGRDTLGKLGDSFLDPMNYLVPRTKYNLAIKGYERVNETSLILGEYEEFKRSALDPYVAIRDAYYQYRENSVRQ